MAFEEKIKEWVLMDNEIKILNEKIKSIREKKSNLSTNILTYVEQNNLSNNQIKLVDGKLKFVNTNIINPITFKYVESCLRDIIKNENQVNQILSYIKQKRENKRQIEIKRYYDK
jgi:hypothetical protein